MWLCTFGTARVRQAGRAVFLALVGGLHLWRSPLQCLTRELCDCIVPRTCFIDSMSLVDFVNSNPLGRNADVVTAVLAILTGNDIDSVEDLVLRYPDRLKCVFIHVLRGVLRP